FLRLAPIYDAHYPRHSPKYLKFVRVLTELQSDLGNWMAADSLLKVLHETADATDIVAPAVRAAIFYHDIYKLARSSSTDGREPLKKRLEEVVTAYPYFSKQSRNRVILAFFALISDNVELADQILNAVGPATAPEPQSEAYTTALRSFIAARRNHFSDSIALSREALDKLISFSKSFEDESASHLPAISIPERAVLTFLVGTNASHISSYDDANTLFRLEQFLNRDKSKLGLNKRITQEGQ